MFRLQLRLTGGSPKLLLPALALLLTLLLFNGTVAREPAGVQASLSGSHGHRYFYLTAQNYRTDEARDVCAPGYHMASLWEIFDPSNLTYAGGNPAAYTRADSGSGPPAGWNGWVRTGGSSSAINVAGGGNCRAWSSVAGGDYGTTVKLATAWGGTPDEISPWEATAFSCGLVGPVWCVSEFSHVYVPLIMR